MTMPKRAVEDDTVTLPRAAYETLLRRAEAAEDAAAAARLVAGDGVYLPIELVDRGLAGEHPLRLFREFRGLTLEALASAAGVGKSYLSQIENRHRNGSVKVLAACARELGVDLDDLV